MSGPRKPTRLEDCRTQSPCTATHLGAARPMTRDLPARPRRVLVGSLLSALVCASAAAPRSRTHAVGMVTRFFADTSRLAWDGSGPRPLRTSVWYPAPLGSPQRSILDASVPFTV